MIPLLLAAIAGLGAFLIQSPPRYSSSARSTTGSRPSGGPRSWCRLDADAWLQQAGLDEVDAREFVAVVGVVTVLAASAGHAVFGGALPSFAVGLFVGSIPVAAYRLRRQVRRQRAHDAWPRMIEEMRVQTASLGRSVPQALFEVGRRGPDELREAFAAAHREWLLTTDLDRTVAVLRHRLADPTADMVCETLLLAHELGGSDLDRRLEALAHDRRREVQDRKDAHSRQAGARFARWFVLAVPSGMALAGMSIGNGRAAYRSAQGQVVVLAALTLVAGCWWWAGRIMRLPEAPRVFTD